MSTRTERVARHIKSSVISIMREFRDMQVTIDRLRKLNQTKIKYRTTPPRYKQDRARLERIAEIISTELTYDQVSSGSYVATNEAIQKIYALSKGQKENWIP